MRRSHFHKNEQSSHLSKATILVVDDERIIREMCEQVLGEYRVLQAGTCAEALSIYEKEQVDLILSDIVMPGESGIELLKKVKTIDPNATVIIMTGFVDKEIILNALKEDADDFINKPLNFIQLKAAVEKALCRKVLKEELASIKRSDQLKNTFLSLVSHKLRTPITGISLFLQNLRTGIFNPGDSAFQQHIAMASEEADYLAQLVADLLAFSKVMIDEAGLTRIKCDLNEIVAETLHKCRDMYCNHDVEVDFTPSDLPPVWLDVSKASFALRQVVDNAFKFSGKHRNITVKTGSHDTSVFITVSDAGIGIPEAEIPKVFEKFYQIDPHKAGQIRGFGLGLFYARDFIRQHGGSISLVSEPGLGTTVTITLPLQ